MSETVFAISQYIIPEDQNFHYYCLFLWSRIV